MKPSEAKQEMFGPVLRILRDCRSVADFYYDVYVVT